MPFRLIQLSDCHLLTDDNARMESGIDTTATLKAVLAGLPAADIILISGDIAHDEVLSTYQKLDHLLQPLNRPVMVLPGNHDNVSAMQQITHWHHEHYINNHWQIIALNSNGPGEYRYSSYMSDIELARLDDTLKAHPQNAIVALHHPPITLGNGWALQMLLDNRADFKEVIDRHPQVKAIIWGHTHAAVDYNDSERLWLSCPSTYRQHSLTAKEFKAMPEVGIGYRQIICHDNGKIKTQINWVSRS